MALFLYFFLSYFLTNLGFLLKRSTKDEFEELKFIVPKLNEIYLLVIYVVFLYFFSNYDEIFFLFFSFIFFALSKILKELIELHNIFFFSLCLILALKSQDFFYLGILPIIYLFIFNSFYNVKLKGKLYELILLIIFFLVLNLIF